jgi:hypothetical protein
VVHLNHSLFFPTLTFQSDAQFKSWGSDSDKSTPVYKLDWGTVDDIKESKWKGTDAVTSDSKFPGTLPQKYDEWVKSMSFAIPGAYL